MNEQMPPVTQYLGLGTSALQTTVFLIRKMSEELFFVWSCASWFCL